MSRPVLPVLALAIAALPAVVPTEASPAAEPEAHSAYVSFRPVANHGLHAYVEGNNGRITLELRREGHLASYRVDGETTEAGLKAQFGQLGLIDVAFTPTKTLRTEEPPEECEGEPSTFREGIFTGTIEFTGERGYVRIDVGRVKGKTNVRRESEWECPGQNGSLRPRGAPRLSAGSSRKQSNPEREALLGVRSRRCRCGFLALAIRNRKGPGPTAFLGTKQEDREEMSIARTTLAETPISAFVTGASAFVFDHAAGTATVHPPRPFSGHGTFKRRRDGRNLWRSTVRVPLLGSEPLSIRGRSFHAVLRRHIPYDE